MTLQEIKTAIENGRRVYWKHEGYPVIKDGIGQFMICYIENQHCWGLTWRDGVTMNEKEEDFYLAQSEAK
jgi:hypothetical protein